jgi:rRNA maturation protein Nop10
MSEAGKRRTVSEETKEKIKAARAKQIIFTVQITCPHCGKTGGNRIMPRYHFDNCKFK